jgi:hypothetical protein
MNGERINLLINKFYSAELTQSEEAELVDSLLQNGRNEEYSADYDIIIATLGNLESYTPDVKFEERLLSGVNQYQTHTRKLTIAIISGIAATLIILLTTTYLMRSNTPFKDTYDDPVIAYNETMKVLQEVSAKLNKGTSGLEKLNKFNEINVQARSQIDKPISVIIENMNLLRTPGDK